MNRVVLLYLFVDDANRLMLTGVSLNDKRWLDEHGPELMTHMRVVTLPHLGQAVSPKLLKKIAYDVGALARSQGMRVNIIAAVKTRHPIVHAETFRPL